jgi:hypothetical protein
VSGAQAVPNLTCGGGVCTNTNPIDTGTLTTDFSGAMLNLPIFDSNVGTLTEVIYTLTDTWNTGGSVTNTAANAQSFTFKVDSQLTLSGGPVQLNTAGSGLDPSANQAYTLLASGGSANFGPFSKAPQAAATLTGAGIGSDWQTPGGAVDALSLSTLTTEGIAGGGGNVNANLTTTADITLSIQYDYSNPCGVGDSPPCPSPEPASMTLLGAGLVGLGAFVRRRRNRA